MVQTLSSLKMDEAFVIEYCKDSSVFKKVMKFCAIPKLPLRVKNLNASRTIIVGNDNFSMAIDLETAGQIYVSQISK